MRCRWRGRVRRTPPVSQVLFAFDLIELDGEDFRPLPLGKRKVRLARLLARVAPGIEFNEHTDADGAAVFRQACEMGLEGIVAKRLTAPYRSGPSRDWLKVKNPDSPAMQRAREGGGNGRRLAHSVPGGPLVSGRSRCPWFRPQRRLPRLVPALQFVPALLLPRGGFANEAAMIAPTQ